MSKIKDRAKMFSNDDKDLEKNLVSNSNPKKSSKPESYQSSNSNFWKKKNIYCYRNCIFYIINNNYYHSCCCIIKKFWQ